MTTTYDTQTLVDRVYDELKKKEITTTKLKLIQPDVIFLNKKTFIKNMKQIHEKLNRDESDVLKYFEEELKAKITVDQTGAFVITGRFQPMNIKNILINYIKTYVLCEQCKGQDTKIVKEKRTNFLSCNTCYSKKALV